MQTKQLILYVFTNFISAVIFRCCTLCFLFLSVLYIVCLINRGYSNVWSEYDFYFIE